MIALEPVLEDWQPPAPDAASLDVDALPETLFANPLRRRGPLLSARYVELAYRGLDIIAPTLAERAVAYRRLVEAARFFHVALDPGNRHR